MNGEHKVMVFETLGPNLDKWLAKPEATGFPLECVKQMSKQLLEGVGINQKCDMELNFDIKILFQITCTESAESFILI